MREILCFGDSNTYGYIPGHYEKAPARYPWGIRWTSLLRLPGNRGRTVRKDNCV